MSITVKLLYFAAAREAVGCRCILRSCQNAFFLEIFRIENP